MLRSIGEQSGESAESVPRKKPNIQKKQVSDPRDRTVLRIELDVHCNKLQRSSIGARRYCQLSRPTTVEFITLGASTFFRAKSMARFDE